MIHKPIKCGIKVYCLVFSVSNYLYNWDIYLGSGSGSIYDLVYNILVPTEWNFCNFCTYCDSHFVCTPLFRDMLLRGIFMTGPTRHKRPSSVARRTPNSHPFQCYTKDGPSIQRGWMRHCYQTVFDTVTGVVRGYIGVTVWKGNKCFQSFP